MKSTIYISIIILLFSSNAVKGQLHGVENIGSPYKEHQERLRNVRVIGDPNKFARTTGIGPIFDTSRWSRLVDSTWGAGYTDSIKLQLFNEYWSHFDSTYACYVGLPHYNWDSIVNAMRSEIMAGTSKGKFTSIINELSRYINDGHSFFNDGAVNYPSSLYPGLPLFRGESGVLGACVTTYNDSLALVYNSVAGQPFGLVPGDIILGYNGIPWKKLVDIVLQHKLPNSCYKGSTEEATYHRYIQAAGENWYLFDTINIQKCDGSIVNLPTSLMNGRYYPTFCTEQMPVIGAHILSAYEYYTLHKTVSYGLLKGTKIGYVYMYDCSDGTGTALYNAVKTLTEDSAAGAFIIDIRTNFGGSILAFISAFEYLNNGDVSWVGYGERVSPTDRYTMQKTGPHEWYDIYDTSAHYFTGPVAMLCGPNAVSAGDLMPILYKRYPLLKLFGKSTAGAYGASQKVSLTESGFYASMQVANFFDVNDPSHYLSHTNVPIDYPVWFDRDSVCTGVDNVVTDAKKWINGILSVNYTATATSAIQVFPNPANKILYIQVDPAITVPVEISIYDITGKLIIKQTEPSLNAKTTLSVNIHNLIAGMYFLKVLTNKEYMRKFTIIR
ncbi:MAG: T9SS type A sorting domain-containing protein [Taibaiella sp.]|nr:T9SS type A sorting domain-containing protein [Taibaiella sp.]